MNSSNRPAITITIVATVVSPPNRPQRAPARANSSPLAASATVAPSPNDPPAAPAAKPVPRAQTRANAALTASATKFERHENHKAASAAISSGACAVAAPPSASVKADPLRPMNQGRPSAASNADAASATSQRSRRGPTPAAGRASVVIAPCGSLRQLRDFLVPLRQQALALGR